MKHKLRLDFRSLLPRLPAFLLLLLIGLFVGWWVVRSAAVNSLARAFPLQAERMISWDPVAPRDPRVTAGVVDFDLRTRMGWGLVYQIHGLSDEEKIAALTHAAEARGLTLSASVLPYLLSHFQRDMRSLSTMLDALDQYSLETQRPVTLPLLRDLLLKTDPKND